MALPGHSRTYKFHTRVIADAAGDGANARAAVWALKDALMGGGSWTDANGDATSAPDWWTVTGSSNGSASSHDGTDRWTTEAGAGSLTDSGMPWIVLASATMGYSIALQKAASGAWNNGRDLIIMGCESASGGSATTAPSYASSITMRSSAQQWGQASSGASNRLYMRQSSLGVGWFFVRNGWVAGFGYLDTLRDTFGSALPIVGLARGTASTPSSHDFQDPLTAQARRVADAGEQTLTLESLSTLGAPSSPDITGEYILRPLITYSTQASELGPRGWMADRYAVVTASDKLGFPDDDDPSWVSLAGYAWPWNKTPLVLTA